MQELVIQLDTLSPLKTLARGYSTIYKEGTRVKKTTDLKPQDKITIRLQDGETRAVVE